MMHIFHKWGKWEQYDTVRLIYFYSIPCKVTATHQRRACEVCGKMQDEFVSSSEFVSLTSKNIPKPK